MVQCLYFSEPFREYITSFPKRGQDKSGAQHDHTTQADSLPTSAGEKVDPLKKQNATTSPTTATSAQENKESWDYQKKLALQAGPHMRMENTYSESYDMSDSLFTALKDLFEAVIAQHSRTGIMFPTRLLEILRANHEAFRSNLHQDAHEFLNTILNVVVDEVEKYSKTHPHGTANHYPNTKVAKGSWVHDLFEGTLTSETRCLTCENVSRRDELFLDLSVDLEENSSVSGCLRKFSEEEMLRERNKFHCDNCCGLQEAEKRMKVKRLPRIFAIHLKRFKYVEDPSGLQLRKLFHRVVYPFYLRIPNTTDDAEDPDRLYELYAVVVHLGATPYHGHYVAIIKTKQHGWLLFDDELVLPVDQSYVRNFFGGDPRNPACAYVLFYQQTTDEAMQRKQWEEDKSDDIPTAQGFDSQGILSSPLDDPGSRIASPTDPIDPNPFNSPLDELAQTVPLNEEIDSAHTAEELGKTTKGTFGMNMKKTTSFNRFRSSNLSVRTKSKFWQLSKDGDDRADAGDVEDDTTNMQPVDDQVAERGTINGTQKAGDDDKDNEKEKQVKEKDKEKKSRFGIGRRRSGMPSLS